MIANDTLELRRKAYTALQSARLPRPIKCEACPETKGLQRHHDDYAKPLDVRWLCRSCHIKHHVALRKAAGTYIHNGGKASMWKSAHALRAARKQARAGT